MTCCAAKFFYFNLVTQSTTLISAVNEDAFFPASNLKDPRKTKIFRTSEGIVDLAVVFDFITTEAVSSVLIQAGPEGLGFSGNITVEANATNVWTGPAFSTTLTPDETFSNGIVSFPEKSYRFWRITCSNPGGDYVELGKVFIGKELIINPLNDRNINFGWRLKSDDNSKVVKNRYGERFIDVINKTIGIRANFKYLSKIEMANLMGMYNYCGISVPAWLVIDEDELFSDNKHRFYVYGYFKDIPELVNNVFSLYDLSFEIEE